jgi:hypothetical protein
MLSITSNLGLPVLVLVKITITLVQDKISEWGTSE